MEVNDQQDIENIEFDVIDFKVFKKKTGKVSHQYTINDQPFLRHKVQERPTSSALNQGARALTRFKYAFVNTAPEAGDNSDH